MISVSVRSVLEDALHELNVLSPGESIDGPSAAFCLRRLNTIFDTWNAQREAVYAELFEVFTLVPNQQNYTIGAAGSSPDWTTANHRPVQIDAANVVLNAITPNVRQPLRIQDYEWWAGVRVRDVSTAFPTDLYFEADWPLGVVHLWPKPSAAYGLELVSRGTHDLATLDGTFSMPPGYQQAATLTLAEHVASGFGRQVTPQTAKLAREARAVIFGNNDVTPRLKTRDAGMPNGGARRRTTFNYLTRSSR